MRYVIGSVLLLAGLIWCSISVPIMLRQHQLIATAEKVPAFILSANVNSRRSGKSTVHSPVIQYRYRFNNNTRESTSVLPFEETGSRGWAQEIVARYSPLMNHRVGINADFRNANAVAFVNPQNPKESFLVKEHSFTPYTLVLIPAALIGVGLLTLLRVIAGARDSMAAIALDASGWKLLLPDIALRKRFMNSVITLILSLALFSPIAIHYLLVTERVRIFPAIALSVLAILNLFLVISLLRAWWVHRGLSDARLTVNPAPASRDQSLQIQVEMDILAHGTLTKFVAALVCQETYQTQSGNKKTIATREYSRTSIVLLPETALVANQMLSGEGRFEISAGSRPTVGGPGFPRYTWSIEILAHLKGAPDYKGTFPLTVI